VRGLPRDLRDYVHLRRRAYRRRYARARRRRVSDPGALCRRRIGRRPVLFQLSRRLRPDGGGGARPHRRPLSRGQGVGAMSWIKRAALVVLAIAAMANAAKAADGTIRVGMVRAVSAGALLIAVERGYFKQLGLNVVAE